MQPIYILKMMTGRKFWNIFCSFKSKHLLWHHQLQMFIHGNPSYWKSLSYTKSPQSILIRSNLLALFCQIYKLREFTWVDLHNKQTLKNNMYFILLWISTWLLHLQLLQKIIILMKSLMRGFQLCSSDCAEVHGLLKTSFHILTIIIYFPFCVPSSYS